MKYSDVVLWVLSVIHNVPTFVGIHPISFHYCCSAYVKQPKSLRYTEDQFSPMTKTSH